MRYAIIGLGKIGAAIAQAFASQGIEVAVAGRRHIAVLRTSPNTTNSKGDVGTLRRRMLKNRCGSACVQILSCEAPAAARSSASSASPDHEGRTSARSAFRTSSHSRSFTGAVCARH